MPVTCGDESNVLCHIPCDDGLCPLRWGFDTLVVVE